MQTAMNPTRIPSSLRPLVRAVLPSDARPARLAAAGGASPDYGRTAQPRWQDVDWSEHVRDRIVLGRRIRYVDIGDPGAPPIVLVHGISANWQSWLEQLPRLAAEGYRALALDLPGFGCSEMPDSEISISGFARIVDAFCDSLGLGPVPLVGHSMGGFISAEAAIAVGDRVERLVLVAAAGITHAQLRREPLLVFGRLLTAATARQLVRIDELVLRPRARHALLSFLYRHPTRIRPELVREVVAGAGTPGFLQALEALLGYDFRERLPEIACPALVVWGTDDMLCPVSDSEEFERLIPNARRAVLEDTGHMILQERAETFNDCLLEFLAEARQASSARPLEATA